MKIGEKIDGNLGKKLMEIWKKKIWKFGEKKYGNLKKNDETLEKKLMKL